MSDDYESLLVTEEFWASITTLEPKLTRDDVEGILAGLDYLDAHPTDLRQRLHVLDRELSGWWSLTPPEPAHDVLRVLVRPEQAAHGGIWRIGPVTWHYRR